MKYKLYEGDCLQVMAGMADNCMDSIVTDPPAGIAFMGKKWDTDKGGRDEWIAWMQAVAAECLRVIKPGGHALVWAIPRTSHWTGMAWENAGWEARDKVYHVFGSGFPKSHNISKAIDKMAGAEREVVGETKKGAQTESTGRYGAWGDGITPTAPATPEAQQWDGWGSALKPAAEEWWLFRAPLAENTIAANVLAWGTGGLNIDGCRVGTEGARNNGSKPREDGYAKNDIYGKFKPCEKQDYNKGRFPANFTHDGSDDVLALFPETTKSRASKRGADRNGNVFGVYGLNDTVRGHDDNGGSAARFFYCSKASKRDRDEGLDEGEHSTHPTVKNTELMRWLCRLITPPAGVVFDPFMGSGSTGKGAAAEGFGFAGIELDADYFEIARRRVEYAYAQPNQPKLL